MCVQAGVDDVETSSMISGIHDTISTLTVRGHGVRLPESLTEDTALAVYENYNLQHRYDVNLPITRYRQDVSLNYCVESLFLPEQPTHCLDGSQLVPKSTHH